MQRDRELPVQTRESKGTGLADPGLASRLGPGIARGAIVADVVLVQLVPARLVPAASSSSPSPATRSAP